jgi:hypothetical protein
MILNNYLIIESMPKIVVRYNERNIKTDYTIMLCDVSNETKN